MVFKKNCDLEVHVRSQHERVPEFKCGLCGKLFERKKVFMEHRKSEHIENVSVCKENRNGACVYGSKECWFKHESEEQNVIDDKISGIKTVELVKRLFYMMEVFADRISNVENQL